MWLSLTNVYFLLSKNLHITKCTNIKHKLAKFPQMHIHVHNSNLYQLGAITIYHRKFLYPQVPTLLIFHIETICVLEFHITRMTLCTSSCTFLKFIYITVCINSPFLLLLSSTLLWICRLILFLIMDCFQFPDLRTKLLWSFLYRAFLLCKNVRVENF